MNNNEILKLYENYINRQSDLEIGIFHFEIARERIHTLIKELPNLSSTEVLKRIDKISFLLNESRNHLEKAGDQPLLSCQKKLENLWSEISLKLD